MFNRLSWDTRPEDLVHHSEHIHGPNCECNPVSALRVQYLRLVHNFFDRDFHNNLNKIHMLSPSENKILSKYQKQIIYKQQLLQSLINSPNSEEIHLLLEGLIILDPEDRLIGLPTDQVGILRNIMRVLKLEKSDSIYRFWLTSCLEAYLRGLGNTEQVFISSFDMLPHLIKHICFDYPSSASSTVPSILSTSTLQSSFDFLGEIIRFNFSIIEKVENILLHDRLMENFFSTLSHHLIDSNVFLRALFVTFDLYHEKYQDYLTIKNNLTNDCGKELIDVDFKFMPNYYYYLPPSCLPRHALYESLSTGITQSHILPLNSDHKTDSAVQENPTAVVGYLSHSWIHFQPHIISSEAEFQLQQHEELKFHQHQVGKKPSPDKLKKITRQKRSPLAIKSPLRPQPTLGSLHDALTSIKNITSRFLTPPSRNLVDPQENVSKALEFEPLDESRLGEIIALETERESRLKACMDVIPIPSQPISKQMGIDHDVEDDSIDRDIFHWNLPPTVKYLSSYLEQQKEHILYELMTIVTLRSINHENICCINTSILIFISAHKRSVSATNSLIFLGVKFRN
jgi:hypothetical protein